MTRTFGFELEYASGALEALQLVKAAGLTRSDHFHSYHCDCNDCAVMDYEGEKYNEARDRYEAVAIQAPDLHAQRDSTADGEFISRILNDWGDLRRISAGLTDAAATVGATTSARCGLHVHVDSTDREMDVAIAYLAFERYFTEIIAPGRASQKRDMNTTLMQSYREYLVNRGLESRPGVDPWKDVSREGLRTTLRAAIQADRHVDLNWSRYRTWEFRVFNATNAAWRIELACRISVAFVEAAPELVTSVEGVLRGSPNWPVGCDSPWGEIARPGWSQLPAPHATKRPIVPMDDFLAILCEVDPDLRPLVERQRSYMRTRYAKMIA